MTAVMVYVWLVEGDVGVPLMVHVLLSMDRPDGSPGETLQLAPATLADRGVMSYGRWAQISVLVPCCAVK